MILDPGANQRFNITNVDMGYCANFVVDGVAQGPISTYEFVDVNSHHTIFVKVSKMAAYRNAVESRQRHITKPPKKRIILVFRNRHK